MRYLIASLLFSLATSIGFSESDSLGIKYFRFIDADTKERIEHVRLLLSPEFEYLKDDGTIDSNRDKGREYRVVSHPDYTEIIFISSISQQFLAKAEGYMDISFEIIPQIHDILVIGEEALFIHEIIMWKRKKNEAEQGSGGNAD